MGDFYVNNKPIRRGLYPSIVTYIIPINNNYIIYNIFYIYIQSNLLYRGHLFLNIHDPRPAFHFSPYLNISYILYTSWSFITYGSVCSNSNIKLWFATIHQLSWIIMAFSKSIKSILFFSGAKGPLYNNFNPPMWPCIRAMRNWPYWKKKRPYGWRRIINPISFFVLWIDFP
jgi:hypothetical protein